MKRFALPIALIVVALAATACASRVPATQVVLIPTRLPTAVAPPTDTAAPPTAAPTAIPATQPPEGTGGGGEGQNGPALVWRNVTGDPAVFTVADPASGATLTTFSVAGLAEWHGQWVGGDSVFYLDDANQVVHRVGFDGQVTDLPAVNSGGPTFEGAFLPSPDGARMAWGTSVFAPGNAAGDTHIQLKVANVDGSGEQTVLDEWLKDESILPTPMAWSPDGKSLYFSRVPYGIGGYILFWGGPNLYRADLTTGLIAEVLPEQGCLCAMAISPDGSTLAYMPGYDPIKLVLRDLSTGVERATDVDAAHMQAGSVLWSPDGKSLVYTMALSNPDKEAYSIVRVDAATLAQTPLVQDDARLLETVAWTDANTVWLNAATAAGGVWRMDATTGAVTSVADGQRIVRAAR